MENTNKRIYIIVAIVVAALLGLTAIGIGIYFATRNQEADFTALEITNQPTRTEYVEGWTFDTAGMVVTAKFSDGSSEVVTGFTVTPAGALTLGTEYVTISHTIDGVTHTATVNITVHAAHELYDIVISGTFETNYVEGQTFNRAGMVVTARYVDDSADQVINYPNFTIYPSRALTIADEFITITYQEGFDQNNVVTVDIPITVVPVELTSIAVSGTFETNYIEGQTFDASGMIVTATFNNGDTEPVTGFTVAPTGALAMGVEYVTVSYEREGVTRTANVDITVIARVLTGVTIEEQPNRLVYFIGDTFDATGMVVHAMYNDGIAVPVTNFTVSPSGALTASDTVITVSFEDGGITREATVNITINRRLMSITSELVAGVQLFEGDTLTNNDLIVTANFNNGDSEIVAGFTFAPTGALTPANTEIEITFAENGVTQTTTQNIIVYAIELTSIVVTGSFERNYVEGQTFNTTGMIVTAYFNNGIAVPVTGFTVDPAGALAMGTTYVTVSYERDGIERTANVNITVIERELTELELVTPPNTLTFDIGEAFDPTGMIIHALHNDGESTPITNFTIYPNRPLTAVDTVVIISFEEGGITRTLNIDITVNRVLTGLSSELVAGVQLFVGSTFSAEYVIVTATFNDGTSMPVTGVTFYPTRALTVADTSVEIFFSEGEVTLSTFQAIIVVDVYDALLNRFYNILVAMAAGNPAEWPTIVDRNLVYDPINIDADVLAMAQEFLAASHRTIANARSANFTDSQLMEILAIINDIEAEINQEHAWFSVMDIVMMFASDYNQLVISHTQTAEFLWYFTSNLNYTFSNIIDIMPEDSIANLVSEALQETATINKAEGVQALAAFLEVVELGSRVQSEFFGLFDGAELTELAFVSQVLDWRRDMLTALNRLGASEMEVVAIYAKVFVPFMMMDVLYEFDEVRLQDQFDDLNEQLGAFDRVRDAYNTIVALRDQEEMWSAEWWNYQNQIFAGFYDEVTGRTVWFSEWQYEHTQNEINRIGNILGTNYQRQILDGVHQMITNFVADWLEIRTALQGMVQQFNSERAEIFYQVMFAHNPNVNPDAVIVIMGQIVNGGIVAFEGDLEVFTARWTADIANIVELITFQEVSQEETDEQVFMILGFTDAIQWIASLDFDVDFDYVLDNINWESEDEEYLLTWIFRELAVEVFREMFGMY